MVMISLMKFNRQENSIEVVAETSSLFAKHYKVQYLNGLWLWLWTNLGIIIYRRFLNTKAKKIGIS